MPGDKEARSTRKVVDAVEEDERGKRDDQHLVTLSSGVVVRIKPISMQFVFAVGKHFERPKVPVLFIETLGREQENPDDPDYQDALQKYVVDIADATNNACILRGTEVVKIPKNVPGPDSEEWKEEMHVLGLPMIDNAKARYLAWFKGMAAATDADINYVLGEIGRLAGVSEEDVADALEKFRGSEARDTDK